MMMRLCAKGQRSVSLGHPKVLQTFLAGTDGDIVTMFHIQPGAEVVTLILAAHLIVLR